MINIVYELSQDFCIKIFVKFGVIISWFDFLIGVDIVCLVCFEICVVFFELFGLIIMEVYDVLVIVVVVCQVVLEVIIMIDNIWVVGILFKVLDFGIDIFIQVGIKYLIGYFDVMVGIVVVNVCCWLQLCENVYLMG